MEKDIFKQQTPELTEHIIYAKLAEMSKDKKNKKVNTKQKI